MAWSRQCLLCEFSVRMGMSGTVQTVCWRIWSQLFKTKLVVEHLSKLMYAYIGCIVCLAVLNSRLGNKNYLIVNWIYYVEKILLAFADNVNWTNQCVDAQQSRKSNRQI